MTKVTVMDIHSINENYIPKLLSMVSESRKERSLAYYFKEDQIRSLCSEILLEKCLFNVFGMNLKEATISHNKYKKPYLKNYNNRHFNISHSGDKIAVIVSSFPCGVDVEKVKPIDLSISDRYFTANEQKSIKEAENPISQFYNFWVLKEAYIKSIGEGLYCPLDSFQISISDDTVTLDFSEKELMNLHLYNELDNYKLGISGTFDLIPEIEILGSNEFFIY